LNRAVIADALGPLENFSLRPWDPGPPAAGHVRVTIKAAGVSFVDVLNAMGKYQGRAPTPFIPGSECSGVVDVVGAGVSGFRPGQAVVATSWGGIFATSANFPASSVSPMPDTLGFVEGAVFMVSVTTAWHALVDRGHLRRGDSLLVLGAGGATGCAAVQIGKYLGAGVIASASTAEKREISMAAGADTQIDARSDTWREDVRSAGHGKPVDVVFDPVGGSATERAFRTLAWNGRHLIVGFPGGVAALPANLPLLKGASLIGVNLQQLSVHEPDRAAANTQKAMQLGSEGHFRPVIGRTFPLERFADAMAAAATGEIAGRIVIELD